MYCIKYPTFTQDYSKYSDRQTDRHSLEMEFRNAGILSQYIVYSIEYIGILVTTLPLAKNK
jgi:hypothetical protein